MALTLTNPHSVLAAIETRPKDVLDVRLASRNVSSAWKDVADAAKGSRVRVSYGANPSPKQKRREKDGRAGGSTATVKERGDVDVKSLLSGDHRSRGFQRSPGSSDADGFQFFVALDCLQDPHNVGAIFRTAAFFGVDGIITSKDRSAPLNATVYDVASGGIEYTPFSQPTNLSRSLEVAKEAGVWVLGTSEHAELDYTEVPLDRPWMLVLGNEERGMRRLTADRCDMVCRIAPRTPVGSLNVSVAAGILIARFAQASGVA